MTALPAERLDKLVRVLGMLGSDHDGERAAAAWQASRIVREAGVTCTDLLKPTSPPFIIRESDAASEWVGRRARRQPAVDWFADCLLCQRHPAALRPWEAGFIRSISTLLSLTPKQRATLAGIAGALRARGLR